ncbi:MAG TPA: Na+/H+ antiporter [Candidatus Limnocylindrales bacterium]|nr:Na+/H+ antiporter [Candidatus Limnocylindrales bacterium]
MSRVELFVALLLAAIPLVGIARRWNVPSPIVLVLGGLVLGFVPGLPQIVLDPDLVLLIFLPPLLYWESITAPTDEMRANWRTIWPLALGLTIATIALVAVVAHALVPGMPWAVAVVLGAVVAPTDELAVVPIADRLGVPRHVTAIIEGESLLNDAGSLVIYVMAIGAAVAGTFAWASAAVAFVVASLGAVAIGLVAGWLAVRAWSVFRDARLQAAISVLAPFIAYVPAVQLDLSGVLAVVTAGVFINRRTPVVLTPAARLQTVGWWETTVFLANAVIFILVGLSMRSVVTAAVEHHHGWGQLLLVALAVNAAIFALRLAWGAIQNAVNRLRGTVSAEDESWKHTVVIAASGFRGAVSLAAALAIPMTIAHGARFPDRALIVFVCFSVILVTLVGGGFSLPYVIRALRLRGDDTEDGEVRKALAASSVAALRRLDALERQGFVAPDQAAGLRDRYERRRRRFAESAAPAEDRDALQRFAVERELIGAQRRELIEMRRRGEIENKVLRRLQLTLDLAETELERFVADASDIGEEESELDTSAPEARLGRNQGV